MTQFEISIQLDSVAASEEAWVGLEDLMSFWGFTRCSSSGAAGYSYRGDSTYTSAMELCEDIETELVELDPFAKITVRGAGGLWSNTPP